MSRRIVEFIFNWDRYSIGERAGRYDHEDLVRSGKAKYVAPFYDLDNPPDSGADDAPTEPTGGVSGEPTGVGTDTLASDPVGIVGTNGEPFDPDAAEKAIRAASKGKK